MKKKSICHNKKGEISMKLLIAIILGLIIVVVIASILQNRYGIFSINLTYFSNINKIEICKSESRDPMDCKACPFSKNIDEIVDVDQDGLDDSCDRNLSTTEKEARKLLASGDYSKECKDDMWKEGSGNSYLKGQCLYNPSDTEFA